MKKLLILLFAVVIVFLCVSCGEVESTDDPEPDITKTPKFEVIFFDIDNIINENGDSTNTVKYNSPSDCYMVKCGNTEILFDCGNAMINGYIAPSDAIVAKNFCVNVLPKLSEHCTDGIIEYLVVTHADYDHIAKLAVRGGLLDMVNDYTKWRKEYVDNLKYADESVCGKDESPIKEIQNIIDFDCPWILDRNLSPFKRENLVVSKITKYKIDEVGDETENITYSTIQGFKGLENSVIVLTDIQTYNKPDLMYVAMSRARSALYVFETKYAEKYGKDHLAKNEKEAV